MKDTETYGMSVYRFVLMIPRIKLYNFSFFFFFSKEEQKEIDQQVQPQRDKSEVDLELHGTLNTADSTH